MLVRRHPGMFYEPFPPRFINNLYLDSEDLQNYEDNLMRSRGAPQSPHPLVW